MRHASANMYLHTCTWLHSGAPRAGTGVNLRFALLAMLSAGPGTGYDLARTFARTVGFVWHAPHSQIYPELRRMEAAGLVVLARLASEVAPVAPERDPVRLRAAYMEFARPEAALAQLESHIAHYTEWLGVWNGMLASLRRREEPALL